MSSGSLKFKAKGILSQGILVLKSDLPLNCTVAQKHFACTPESDLLHPVTSQSTPKRSRKAVFNSAWIVGALSCT
jgi:hypothetical protein